MIRAPLLLVLALFYGCSHPDCARSAATAQVQVEAIRQELNSYAGTVTDAALHARLTDWSATLEQAGANIAPAITMLAEGAHVEPVVSVEQVLANAPRARAKAAVILGRAEREVEDAKLWWQAKDVVGFTLGAVTGGDWLATLLAGGGTAGLLAALAGKAIAFVRSKNAAIKEAVQTGEELAAAGSPEDVRAVKMNAAKRQKNNGTKGHIDDALKKVVTPVTLSSPVTENTPA